MDSLLQFIEKVIDGQFLCSKLPFNYIDFQIDIFKIEEEGVHNQSIFNIAHIVSGENCLPNRLTCCLLNFHIMHMKMEQKAIFFINKHWI